MEDINTDVEEKDVFKKIVREIEKKNIIAYYNLDYEDGIIKYFLVFGNKSFLYKDKEEE